jgi:hypothetical protein
MSYGAVSYKFIERKVSLFTYGYLGFLVFPPKILNPLVEMASWRISLIALKVILILIQMD